MSLTTKTMHEILSDCDYYKDVILRPDYFKQWTIAPASTYNYRKKCRQLEEKRLFSRFRDRTRDTFFRYKPNRKIELFGNYKKSDFNFKILTIIIILFLFTYSIIL